MSNMKTYQKTLRNGEIIVFKTDMPQREVEEMPEISGQFLFLNHFYGKAYNLEIVKIIKPNPVGDENE